MIQYFRGGERDERERSRNWRDGEFSQSIGCKCKDCVNLKKACKANAVKVNEVELERRCQHDCCNDKEHNVQLCEAEDIKIDVEFVVNHNNLEKFYNVSG